MGILVVYLILEDKLPVFLPLRVMLTVECSINYHFEKISFYLCCIKEASS